MKEKFPLSYRSVQRIKAEEFERFFSRRSGYTLHMNHLGEVKWLTREDSESQHEFFPYEFSTWERLKHHYRLKRKIQLEKLSKAERELRMHFRHYLQEKYPGKSGSGMQQFLPSQWTYDLNDQDLENIPLALDFSNEALWKRLAILVSALALVTIIALLWILNHRVDNTGELLVRSDIQGGRVYLEDSRFLGYTNQIIRQVPAGMQKIYPRKEGYSAAPESFDIRVVPDTLITLDVQFTIRQSEILGYVRILADQKDSRILVNDTLYGILSENKVFPLEISEDQGYRITLKKDGYLTFPPEKLVRMSTGDTTVISFHQVPEHGQRDKPSGTGPENIGTISVSSNIKSASIWLNGQDSREKTDHIFTQLPLGSYSVQVRKEGYGIDPKVINLRLSRGNPDGNAAFTISRELESVRITTTPGGGKIFIDGEMVGESVFQGQLPLGEYQVTFGEVGSYKRPTAQTITVRAGFPVNLNADYFPEMSIRAGISDRGNLVYQNCEVFTGHTFKDRAFTPSVEGAPSVEFDQKLNGYFWKLGYAYAYRNPKGNDAVKVVFELPKKLDYDQKFTLRIQGASTRDKYPFALSGNTEVTIKFNNTILSYNYTPKFVEDLGGVEVKEWDVTSYIRPGSNSVEVYTTDKNNTYYYLKLIEVFN